MANAPTVSDLAVQLVQRGWPKVDPPQGELPDGPSWAFRSYPHNSPGPQAVISLWIPGGDQDHDLAMAVCSCECCEAIAKVQWFDPSTSYLIAEVLYWPGLDDSVDLGRLFFDQLNGYPELKRV
ncbi:hypothetical protein [Synechococcus sp. LA31]|uniref:hypothetical protein n=1 Tax=Synechococcus sp. LA31 TaxID=2741953 RepID=UPI001BDC9CBC|nr:hypothetical protein [Synechococcus sp. LA31]QVV66779.1 hypothetical protein KJJ24_09810 [Synechococcus sp. LA31]